MIELVGFSSLSGEYIICSTFLSFSASSLIFICITSLTLISPVTGSLGTLIPRSLRTNYLLINSIWSFISKELGSRVFKLSKRL